MPEPANNIRLATKADIPEICKIERSATAKFLSIPALAFLVAGDVLSVEKVEYWLEAGRIYIFDDEDRKPLGFLAAYHMDTALYIAEISVLNESNGKGVGSTLMDTVKAWARERAEGEKARVSLTTYPDVPWNGPFYRKRGFVEVEAETIGPKHVHKMTTDKEERELVQPGYRRCCMLWEDQ